MNARIANAIRKNLLNVVEAGGAVREIEAQLVEARAGMYLNGVKAAIAAKGDADTFNEVCGRVADEFRANVNGIAVKYGCEQQKDTKSKPKVDADGNPIYCVPSALSAVRTHLTQAIEFGIDMGTAKAPKPYTAIKDAKDVAKAEYELEHASEDEKLIAATGELIDAIWERVCELEGRPLKAVNVLIADLAKKVDKAA